jgi:UDP-N-acetylglucosamine diphosphorylase/glucosamine-1-phosphate N-acetyltransferase
MGSRRFLLFEDEQHRRFHPIGLTRPVWDILAGARTNRQRIEHHVTGEPLTGFCRPYLSQLCGGLHRFDLSSMLETDTDLLVLLNGRAVFRASDGALAKELRHGDGTVAYVNGDQLVAAVLTRRACRDLFGGTLGYDDLKRSSALVERFDRCVAVPVATLGSIWDLVSCNGDMITADFEEYYQEGRGDTPRGRAHCYGRAQVWAAPGVEADAGSVLDARSGPIILEAGAAVTPLTHLEGPLYVGKGTVLFRGKIGEGSSIGRGCRVGGEVENTVVAGNSNKYHDGFIGHAYIGEWVNLGAMTTNSDLANNYSDVKVQQNGTVSQTGRLKVGCFVGDHTKTGIGTLFNTGVVVGFSCNLFGGRLILEREVPSFAWGNDQLRRTLRPDRAIETARIAMQRRRVPFQAQHERLFAHLFDASSALRAEWRDKRQDRFL